MHVRPISGLYSLISLFSFDEVENLFWKGEGWNRCWIYKWLPINSPFLAVATQIKECVLEYITAKDLTSFIKILFCFLVRSGVFKMCVLGQSRMSGQEKMSVVMEMGLEKFSAKVENWWGVILRCSVHFGLSAKSVIESGYKEVSQDAVW